MEGDQKGSWYPQTISFSKSEKENQDKPDKDKDSLQKRMTMDLVK